MMSQELSKTKLRLPALTRETLEKGKFEKWRTAAWSVAMLGGYQSALVDGAENNLPNEQVNYVDMPHSTQDEIKAAGRVEKNVGR
jgi:hypothetical protein